MDFRQDRCRFRNPPDGKYTLKETGGAFTDAETKKTYTVIESTMTFTVENGVVTDTNAADNLNDKATEGYYYYDKTAGQILVCDAEAVNVVPISKQDAASGAEVAGATLEDHRRKRAGYHEAGTVQNR